jgi:hypothetical protein
VRLAFLLRGRANLRDKGFSLLSTSGGISLVPLAGLKWGAGWLEAGRPG